MKETEISKETNFRSFPFIYIKEVLLVTLLAILKIVFVLFMFALERDTEERSFPDKLIYRKTYHPEY